jgi:cathepsin B
MKFMILIVPAVLAAPAFHDLASLDIQLDQPTSTWPVPLVSGAELEQPAITEELLAALDSVEKTWTHGKNARFEGLTLGDAKKLMGSILGGPIPGQKVMSEAGNGTLPDDFDWREQMGDKCPSIKEVRDQSNCGSCWAFGSVEAMTDRMCISSKGAVNHRLSAQDPVSCCGLTCGNGCEGGLPAAAWNYFKGRGIVTGGPYGDHSKCYSYQMAPCAHHAVDPKHKNCTGETKTPACRRTCEDSENWASAKIHNTQGSVYNVAGEAALRQEIYEKGPVTGMFMVFADFLTYKSGVYAYSGGGLLGGHAVEIIGYGTEATVPYWLVKNSWNNEWGDNGFFKIVRGTNFLRKLRNGGIDSGVLNGGPTAGEVNVPKDQAELII